MTRPLRFLSILLLLLCRGFAAQAQPASMLTSGDGLTSSLINNIYQDSKGYVWIATEYGLNRYDGTSIRSYLSERGDSATLCDSYVHTMIETAPGNMLVGTVKGLMSWDSGSESFRYIPLSLNKQPIQPHITDITRLSNGEIWIGTAGYGLFRYKADSQEAERISGMPAFVENAFISDIFEDSSHTIWIGTENSGLCRIYPSGREGRKGRIYRAPEIGGDKISSIAEDTEKGIIYVGSLDGGVTAIGMVGGEARRIPGEAVAIKSLMMAAGECYAGTEGRGVRLVSPQGLADMPLSSPLATLTSGKVHQMMADREGNLWIGLYQQGVGFIPSQRRMFASYGRVSSPANPIGEGCVMAICHADGRRLWVSCDNEGIYQLDENRRRLRHIPLPSTATCLFSDSKGRLWAGTFNSGLFLIPPAGETPQKIAPLGNVKIYSIGEDSNGHLCLATFGRGVVGYNPESGSIYGITAPDAVGGDSNRPQDWVNSLLPTADGKIWLAHYGGVSCFDTAKKRFLSFSGKENIVDDCLGYAIAKGKDGKIWLGTSDGLYSHDPASGKLEHFTTSDGLPNSVVCGICEDEGGNLWISTYRGLAKFDPSTRRFVTFDSGDGLQSNEFTHGAFCKDPNGNVYFGGVNGFSVFYPYDINDKPREYNPVLTWFGIFSERVTTNTLSGGRPVVETGIEEAEKVSVSSRDNTFSIGFSTLTYDNPEKLIYEYRILEHGNGWLSTLPGQNHITLNNMSPGKYHFQLRVAGDESENGTRKLLIEVRLPWYQSWWAILIYLLVGMGLIVASVHFVRLKDSQRREREDRRRSEEVLEAKLQFFTNISHEIRTPMTLIINPLERLLEQCRDPHLKSVYSIIYRNANRILNLVNQLMDMRKLEKGQVRLKMRETEMVGFINNAMLPFEYIAGQKKISFTFTHDEEPVDAWVDPSQFDKVLLNVFSNAFKYTPQGGEISVSLHKGSDKDGEYPLDRYVELTVADTGIGIDPDKLEKIFERFYRIGNDITDSSSGTGIGLHLCRSLVELHHGSISARNRREQTGCEIIIRIPEGSAHLSEEEMKETDANETATPLPRHSSPELAPEPEADPKQKPRTKKTVAIIEDDPDIRNFLTSELCGDYKVTTYDNGDDALKAILSADAPDIIISDVMMPGIDGYQLCKRVKQNVNVNHIPVVLISARTDDRHRILGLEAGADSYMAKPFNIEVLRTTVASLLNNRNLLKAKFSGMQHQEESVKKISLKSHDEVLLNKIMDVVNANISSSEFSVEMLASEVGLSRVHLHRKLKELTNLPARDFIRSIRLREAARLLKEKKLSVAEVAYATGFSNPSHFSNSFKEMFGVPPTVYASKEGEG